MPNPQLPQEITEKVIDCASSNVGRVSRKPVSLVSKAWLPRSRFHLFRRLRVIISQVNPDPLEDLLHAIHRGSESYHSGSILPAVEFVQELHVSDTFRTRSQRDGDEEDEARPSLLPTLARVLYALPRLRVLSLDAHVYGQVLQFTETTPRPSLLTLKHLSLSVDADLRSLLPFLASVATLSITAPMNVEQLSTRRGLFADYGCVSVGTAIITARVLRSEYAAVLREIGSLMAVTHLKLECDMMMNWTALGELLRAESLANSVRSITIDVRNCDLSGARSRFGSVDLTRLRQLESLALQGLPKGVRGGKDGFKFVTTILNAWSPAPQLRILRLDFIFQVGLDETVAYMLQSMDQDWMRLEGALLSWSLLCDILIQAQCICRVGNGRMLSRHVPKDYLEHAGIKKMPTLGEKGSLLFV